MLILSHCSSVSISMAETLRKKQTYQFNCSFFIIQMNTFRFGVLISMVIYFLWHIPSTSCFTLVFPVNRIYNCTKNWGSHSVGKLSSCPLHCYNIYGNIEDLGAKIDQLVDLFTQEFHQCMTCPMSTQFYNHDLVPKITN